MAYSVEDLLKVIGEGGEKLPSFNDDVEEFIHQYKLLRGSCRIPNHVIYYLYKKEFNGQSSKIGFFRKLSKHFDSFRVGKRRGYKIDGLELDEETKLKAEYFKKELENDKKET